MKPSERAYYLTDYSDEIVPCDCTLQGWANWLSKPDPDWQRSEPAVDGDRFSATVLRFCDDIIATHGAHGWTFSREPDPADFMAVRYGEGLGWSADMLVEPKGLAEWFAENGTYCDDVEYIAVATNEPPMMVTYHANPPRCIAEVVQ